jgi:ankyrin repeat protein
MIASLERLGTKVTPSTPTFEKIDWPRGPTFEGTFGSWNVWLVRLGIGGDAHDGLVRFGEYDGGNYGLFLGGGDSPYVYSIDHDDGSPRSLATLDDFLAGLKPTPEPKVLGALETELLEVLRVGGDRALEEVTRLLDAGADANTANEYGVTALHFAAGCAMIRDEAKVPLIARLLAGGADARAALPGDVTTGMAQGETGKTALHFLLNYNTPVEHVAAVRALIAAGADVNAADRVGVTPLHRAALAGVEFSRALLEAGANANVGTLVKLFEHPAGKTPLHELASTYDSTRLEHLAMMLAVPGIDVNVADAAGQTPLHIAAMTDSVEAVDALLRAGADPTRALTSPLRPWWAKRKNVKLPIGTTPLMAAQRARADAAASRLGKGQSPAPSDATSAKAPRKTMKTKAPTAKQAKTASKKSKAPTAKQAKTASKKSKAPKKASSKAASRKAKPSRTN